jgi:hypothetical protein
VTYETRFPGTVLKHNGSVRRLREAAGRFAQRSSTDELVITQREQRAGSDSIDGASESGAPASV